VVKVSIRIKVHDNGGHHGESWSQNPVYLYVALALLISDNNMIKMIEELVSGGAFPDRNLDFEAQGTEI
jgi:hypothetical protein